MTVGIKAGGSVFNQTCTALSWERIHNSNSDMSSANMKAVPLSLFPPWECPSEYLSSEFLD